MLTVYFKRKPPASVYDVRNEQGFRTPGVQQDAAVAETVIIQDARGRAPSKRQRRAVQLHQRRLQQLCFDGRKTVPEALNAFGHCVRLL